MSENTEKTYQDLFGRYTDAEGTPLVPLTEEQARIGKTGEVITIEEAVRTGVELEAIGGMKTFYAYDRFYEVKERIVPVKDAPIRDMKFMPLWIERDLDVVKNFLGMISGEELRRDKAVGWFYGETTLATDMILDALAILTTPYAGQMVWLGHKDMSYSKHNTLVGEAGHWLLHDPRTPEEALESSSLTLQMCLSLINDDPNADEGLDPSAVQEALRTRFGYLLDTECDYCGKTFREEGE